MPDSVRDYLRRLEQARVECGAPDFAVAQRTPAGLSDGLSGTATVPLRNAAVPAARASGDAGVTRNAAVPAALASGDAGATDGGLGVRVHDRGYLPHWEAKGSIYFITFRSPFTNTYLPPFTIWGVENSSPIWTIFHFDSP